MFIFWSGAGWIVPAGTFGSSLVSEIVWETATRNDQYYQEHGLPLALALWISATIAAIVFCRNYLLPAGERFDEDPPPRPGWMTHSFMFINIGVWGLGLFVAGIVALLQLGV